MIASLRLLGDLARVKKALGVDQSFPLNRRTAPLAMSIWKDATVSATRAGDQEKLRELSQVKEVLKRVLNPFKAKAICSVCGVPISGMGLHCMMHVPRRVSERNKRALHD